MSLRLFAGFCFLTFLAAGMHRAWAEGCVPITEARDHMGKTTCITGRVVKVTRIASGTHFLNFCEDYRVCPFQVVVFRSDLKHVGDIRQLEGRIIEIHGEIKDYDGRPEIVLKDADQLKGEGTRIPPLPKNYDVQKKGRYSAGRFKHPKATRRSSHKPQGKPIETGEVDEQ